MKLLFVAYCFGSYEGQALIGVYKRGLRLAMEMCERGHELAFFCTGRQAYQDELTRAAEERMEFVDIPFTVAAYEEAERNREVFRREIARLAPDLLVIGEAPLSGAMLEATQAGVELGIPVVFLDNAYNALFVELFLRSAGPMADGIVLMGPSSHHLPDPPAHLCQVPPFMESDPDAAREQLASLGLSGERLTTVLGYDSKVAKLAASLTPALCEAGSEVLFLARDPEGCLAGLPELSASARERVRATPIPSEETLIGLLEVSGLAIVKYGFMQVAECLTLRTPAIVVYHEGPTWLDYLPQDSRRYAWVTSSSARDRRTVERAIHYLGLDGAEMEAIHRGGLGAIPRAADFLEALPREPRSGTELECEALGFGREEVLAALAAELPRDDVELSELRALRLRTGNELEIYSLLARLVVAGKPANARLWGRRYLSEETAATDGEAADLAGGDRRLLYASPNGRVALEMDLGEALLPELNP